MMSGPGSMAIRMTKMESQLECPVCFNIPRDLPVPSCPAGHIVCRPCKERVEDCHTCRQPMPANMTNSVVGALIEQVQHSCKYNDQGCQVKMMLEDLVTHEKQCQEKIIECPYYECDKLVKLKDFDKHTRFSHLKILTNDSSLRFTIAKNDVISDEPKVRMACIMALDQQFHVSNVYHEPSNCFVISVWLAKRQVDASKYRVNIIIEGNNKKFNFDGIKVCSVENIPTIDERMEENGNDFLCLQWSLARNISEYYFKNDGITEEMSVRFIFKKI